MAVFSDRVVSLVVVQNSAADSSPQSGGSRRCQTSGARPPGQAPDRVRLGLRRLFLAENDQAVQDPHAEREDRQ